MYSVVQHIQNREEQKKDGAPASTDLMEGGGDSRTMVFKWMV
jgi:hypothetical protein